MAEHRAIQSEQKRREWEQIEAAIKADLDRQRSSISPSAKRRIQDEMAKECAKLILSALSQGNMNVACKLTDMIIKGK